MTMRRLFSRMLAVAVAGSMSLTALADPYPLATDPVTGEALGNHPVIVQHEGRELRFSNKDSAEAFKADPKAHLAKLDKQLAEQQRAHYPLDTCVIAGGKLGSMGDPAEIVYNNRLVRFCCAGCAGAFNKNPEAALKKIDAAAVAKQKAAYPLKECVVSGEALGSMGEPINKVVANRLVQFCCAGCVDEFNRNPAKYLAKLDGSAGAKSAHSPKQADGTMNHQHGH